MRYGPTMEKFRDEGYVLPFSGSECTSREEREWEGRPGHMSSKQSLNVLRQSQMQKRDLLL